MTAHTVAGGFAASEIGESAWRKSAVKTACRLAVVGFVRQVCEFGRGRLLQGVVEVRPYSAPCGTFGRRALLWPLILPDRSPRSLSKFDYACCCTCQAGTRTRVARLSLLVAESPCSALSVARRAKALPAPSIVGNGPPSSGRKRAPPFSNVCIREHGLIYNGGCVRR